MNRVRSNTLIVIFLAYIGSVLPACGVIAHAPRTAIDVPHDDWQRGGSPGLTGMNWLSELDSDALRLNDLVNEAIANNFQLKQQAALVDQAQQALVFARADRLPALTLSLDSSRRRTVVQNATATTSNFELGVDAQWEVDIWGQLNQAQRAASLSLAAQEASYEATRRSLAGNIAASLFDVVEARSQFAVFEQRVTNAGQSLDIVASGYRQGLNEALDLYLAQNAVQQEKANLAQQRQVMLESTASLQLLLARYPDGAWSLDSELPLIDTPVPTGLPSSLLTRRADIQQAWLNLLAADASLAAAHRQRFPRLSLVGTAGQSSAALSDLLDSNSLAWTLLSSVTTPIFDAGRLKAVERQSAAQVIAAEQQYLDLVYRAFAQVENAISRAATLRDRYNAFVLAEQNARAALELALDQYQSGLTTYTTVLESQRRAFDATTTVVALRNQLLQNRIELHLAIGGEFITTP